MPEAPRPAAVTADGYPTPAHPDHPDYQTPDDADREVYGAMVVVSVAVLVAITMAFIAAALLIWLVG